MKPDEMNEAYRLAQTAMANLKTAIRLLLSTAPDQGLSNAEIGRALGIYGGHVGHEGHVSRTLLAFLESEGVARQDEGTKRWRLANGTHSDQRIDAIDR